ncbi:conjugal transfer protein TraF [Psittacicella gerlachiana]|uniref:Uncharacterized protein n=1 Tax=Psittacicella gerlachiana TaxID=2028574 RepID=A0A3A1Y678_9GAMM|nr:conjugal transfer protein TraF [Psittacicella gerlachiana]RIY33763.1 hypothetical protein CKF59_06195 [Psittacicella gerlachiana]
MIRYLIYLLLSFLSGQVFASNQLTSFSYHLQNQGWFYYNWQLLQEQEREQGLTLEQLPPVPTKISSAWLRQALPLYLEFAMDNPSEANVLAYLYLQTYAQQKAALFSEQAQLVTQGNAILDSNAFFPQNAMAQQYREQMSAAMRQNLIRLHAPALTLVFTVAQDYESKNFTALAAKAASELGIKVEIYEVNGKVHPELKDFWHQRDPRKIQSFLQQAAVEIVPSVHIFSPSHGAFLVEGAVDLQEFEQRIIRYLYLTKLISRTEYNLTRGVINERQQDPEKIQELINDKLLKRSLPKAFN